MKKRLSHKLMSLAALCAMALCLVVGGIAVAEEGTNSSANTSAEAASSANASTNINSNSSSANNANKAANENQGASGRTGTPLDLGDDNLINTQQLPDSSFIYDTSIADLATADTYIEGQTVQTVGEVVGDRIQAELEPKYSWIVLADSEGNTVSVFMLTESTALIDTYGRYGSVGTTLQVRGTFNLACRDHQGQTDIHADNVSVISRGKTMQAEFNPASFIPGLVLLVIGLSLIVLLRVLRNRMR